MIRLWPMVLPLFLSVAAIKVPITSQGDSPTELSTVPQKEPILDSQLDSSHNEYSPTDSYQLQPEGKFEAANYKDSENNEVPIPSRFLLPPRLDAEVYTYPTGPKIEDNDWTPMTQKLPNVENGPPFAKIQENSPEPVLTQEYELPQEVTNKWFNPELINTPSSINGETKLEPSTDGPVSAAIPIIIPSRHLQPPLPDNVPNVNFETPLPAMGLQPPLFKPQPIFRPYKKLKPIMPTISLEMQPPTPSKSKKYNNPTKLFPKKYSKVKVYQPVPIPMQEFHEGDIQNIPKAKPIKFVKPILAQEDYVDDEELEVEKKILKYQQAEEKRKFREEEDAKKQQEFVDSTVAETFASPPEATPEQEASETGFHANGQDSYVAALPAQTPVSDDAPPAPAERTEFRMHGLQGPHSYKFGYDTGKGKNRQFRYEERNNDGHVRGHYGYMDRHGKTHVVNYDAHPERGFHAEGPFGKV